ncbi:MAG TPA: S9 family peptidase, partial [Candidatus Polarisedimenticolia bacterium]|nr:S9 family peptidase [Candidatus Polarisedimenticolia bacterium]
MRRLALAVLLVAVTTRAETPLIPREALFGNAERTKPAISPDAKRLAWLQPEKGVLQVWVQTLGKEDAEPVSADRQRPIRRFQWAQDSRTILYTQDVKGNEDWHVYGVDLESKQVRDLTPFDGVRAEIVADSPRRPSEILVEMNLQDRGRMDVHRIDLRSGAVTLVTRNPGTVTTWGVTDDLVVKAAIATRPDGGEELLVRDPVKGTWRTLSSGGPDDQLQLLDLTADGKGVLYVTTAGGETGRVVQRSLSGGPEKVLAVHPEVEPIDVAVHPTRHVVEGVVFEAGLPAWTLLDPTVKKDFDVFAHLARGFPEVVSRDRADRTWVVSFRDAQGPTRYFLFDRTSLQGKLLFVDRPKLESVPLAEMKPVRFPARDGLVLHGYLNRPVGAAGAGPMVLLVHGGPWGRNVWKFDSSVQWLANRGYSVLQINFRGSTGYGRRFMSRGNRQWGKDMQTDLLDAVDWAVKEGVAAKDRVAIMGGSYGGYAVLAAAAFTPEAFRCGVDIVGPSNLFTLLRSVPPYWKPLRSIFNRRIGNIDAPADKQLLESASPLFSAEKIKMPLLIGQGANDPRVKQAESEQIVAALEKHGLGVTYVVYTDEGHGFARPENAMDFNARAEAFLAQYLGGR